MAKIDLEGGKLLIQIASPYDICSLSNSANPVPEAVSPSRPDGLRSASFTFDTMSCGKGAGRTRFAGNSVAYTFVVVGTSSDSWKQGQSGPANPNFKIPIPFYISRDLNFDAALFHDSDAVKRFAFENLVWTGRKTYRSKDDTLYDTKVNQYAKNVGQAHQAMSMIGSTAQYSRPRLPGGEEINNLSNVTIPVYVPKTGEVVDVTARWHEWEPHVKAEVERLYSRYLESFKYEPSEPSQLGPYMETDRSSTYYDEHEATKIGFELHEVIPSTDLDTGDGGSKAPIPVYKTEGGSFGILKDDEEYSSLWDDALLAMEKYDVEQALQLKLSTEGLANTFSIARPEATTHSDLTVKERKITDDWWADKQRIWNNVLALNTENAAVGQQRYEDDVASGSTTAKDISSYKAERLESERASLEAEPKTWLTSLWDTLKGLTSYVGDVVKDWGPTSIIGAWAGYEAVKSAKKSSIPMWLIVAGVGLIALTISS